MHLYRSTSWFFWSMLFAELVSSPLQDLSVWLSDYGKVTMKAGEAFILTEGTIISLVIFYKVSTKQYYMIDSITGILDQSSYRASVCLLATDFTLSVVLLACLFVDHTP